MILNLIVIVSVYAFTGHEETMLGSTKCSSKLLSRGGYFVLLMLKRKDLWPRIRFIRHGISENY